MLAASNHPPPPSHQPSYAARRIASPLPPAHRMRVNTLSDDGASASAASGPDRVADGGDGGGEDNPRLAESKLRYEQTASRIAALFSAAGTSQSEGDGDTGDFGVGDGAPADQQPPAPPAKKPARKIDEDDYGDDDDEEDEDAMDTTSPAQTKSDAPPPNASHLKVPPLPTKLTIDRKSTNSSSDAVKSPDDVRKRLEENKKAMEDAAKRSFHHMFYTLEYDRDAMLEQQKLDELDRQVEADMSRQAGSNGPSTAPSTQQGSLSSANLGASSLTLKHLIARIDSKRGMIQASDTQLRSLISEVRKNRSKWASEEKVGQEELYEAAEKVLMELKAMTEHSGPFLQRVNKRDAPDYYQVIKHPMDIGTMIKKLKGYQYKSKKEFVDDLNLIWSNCLKYNADPAHFLRKKALYMRKETEKLVPLIPDIVVRDRAEVEAEERRMQNGDHDLDGAEDSDDEPIMASRGRKAPKKGTTTARKAPPGVHEGTPGAETKPPGVLAVSSTSNLRNEFLRADSDAPMDGSRLSTPPGNQTPLGPNGILGAGAPGSQADVSEVDADASASGGVVGSTEDLDMDDTEFKTWKQVTKKDRAMAAAQRNRLFRGNRLNPDEPASLRSKAGMRRWLRQHKHALNHQSTADAATTDGTNGAQPTKGTLAEGIEEEDDQTLPDYYDPVNAIPDLDPKLQWVEDSDGNPIFQSEEFLRTVPKGHFVSPESDLTKRMEANMRQMQDTRKICSKIGIVKQMQLQAQTYQNQFQKYDPQPFMEHDIETHVTSSDGPIMAQESCRAALQRSVAKIFYHAGFEEYQPSALDAVTDITGAFFQNLVKTLQLYRTLPKVKAEPTSSGEPALKHMYTAEETILHTLQENGMDVESLEFYVKDDVDRLGSKLGVMHERMRSHMTELMRPALDSNAGPDGVGAFDDGSEQFVGGDFAEDIDEDYLGLKELGLDKEFGLNSLSVPLHLLQNRVHNAYQAQHTSVVPTIGQLVDQPAPFEPVTTDNVTDQIGLVQHFFRNKLHENNDEPLLEDEDLPAKQRFPKPRLPPTGKISSPRKRPPKEQQQMARKKRRLEEGKEDPAPSQNAQGDGAAKGITKPAGKLKLEMPASKDGQVDPEKDAGSAVGMMSPESIGAT